MSQKVIPRIIRNCTQCLFHKEGQCHFMYIQHLESGIVYFEKAEVLRMNNKQCGEEGKWYIGNEAIRVDDVYSKKHCYDGK